MLGGDKSEGKCKFYPFSDAELMEISGNRFALKDSRDAFRGISEQSTRFVVRFESQRKGLVRRGAVGAVLHTVGGDVRQQLEAKTRAPDGEVLAAVVHLDCDVVDEAARVGIAISLIEPSRTAGEENSEKWETINSGPSQQVSRARPPPVTRSALT